MIKKGRFLLAFFVVYKSNLFYLNLFQTVTNSNEKHFNYFIAAPLFYRLQ